MLLGKLIKEMSIRIKISGLIKLLKRYSKTKKHLNMINLVAIPRSYRSTVDTTKW
jgi:hypothetical protein